MLFAPITTSMALYQTAQFVTMITDKAFDELHNPGVRTPHSGIYRCEGCSHEVAANATQPLPPQNHHQHTASQGQIRWRLAVYAKGA